MRAWGKGLTRPELTLTQLELLYAVAVILGTVAVAYCGSAP